MMKMAIKIIFLFPFILFLAGCQNNNPEASQVQDLSQTQSSGSVVIENNNVKLGEIPIKGGTVDSFFTFKNTGQEPLALLEGETSCMCTEAVVESEDGVISPRIKMAGHGGAIAKVNQVLDPGETATLIATFDPMAHGPNAVGPIKRDVYLKTNSAMTPEIKFSFQGTVIKGDKKVETPAKTISDLIENTVFNFTEKSFDFGTIKQSGGKVSHDFLFTYEGQTPITITGVPTSCACASATVEPTTLSPGDTGVLSVKFNPNLHQEPSGRFFKTVSLLIDPEPETIPEVKIWTEIDLDLGVEAFELQSDNHDDIAEDGEVAYHSVTPQVFSDMLKAKDFTLIDTHIPEQAHIKGTDTFIPYDRILESENLPKDKQTKIVLYCRSGGMSRAAASQLAEVGYSNIYDLAGGKRAYDQFLDQ